MSARVSFLDRSNQRTLAPGFQGDVFVWDIDKTYLDTRFSSVRGLMAIPFELAVDKRALPGAIPLLRAIRRGPGPKNRVTPLYFVSGSPPQLRRIIEKKMVLDSVDFDGITFKDQWGLVRARRMKDVKGQVGYKLKALLLYRRDAGPGARFFMFGDDVEADAYVFSLFGEILAGNRGAELERAFSAHHVHPDDRREIMGLLEEIEVTENPVAKVFIHLTNETDPASFTEPRVVPVRSFLQATLVLVHDGRVAPTAIHAVALDLRRNALVPEATIETQLVDAEARLGVPRELTELARSAR